MIFAFIRKFFPDSNSSSSPVLPVEAPDETLAAARQAYESGDLATAEHYYDEVLRRDSTQWRAWLGKGNIFFDSRRFPEAITAFTKAREMAPGDWLPCYGLGRALAATGQFQSANVLLETAVLRKPDSVDALMVLSDVQESLGRFEQALGSVERALKLVPNQSGILWNRALLQEKLRRPADACDSYRAILALHPDDANAWSRCAFNFRSQGLVKEALACLERSLALAPSPAEYSNWLMTYSFSDEFDLETSFAAQRAYAALLAAHLPRVKLAARSKSDDILRVGFLSPDFWAHPVAQFIEPLVQHLDRTRFRIFAYSACPEPDAVTARLRPLFDEWRDICKLDAEVAAARISSDQVDILIDLAGHTGNNRLDVMSMRPAPVQATWLGYLDTTGLDAIDFRIVDAYTDPPGLTESQHVEQLIRLTNSQWCYQADLRAPEVSPLPAMRNGHITFGSFNQSAKLGDHILRTWGQLISRLPQSRLVVAAAPPGPVRDRILGCLASEGVQSERITFLDRTDYFSYLSNFSLVDISLDSFPYTGGTTTCDSLYMGVPVLSLAGHRSVSRSGVSLLSNLGLADWIAESAEDFISKGEQFALDVSALQALRSGLRPRFLASPLADSVGFAKGFADALEQMHEQKQLMH